jgi:enoyl-CoA hydratase/carnithine racemase
VGDIRYDVTDPVATITLDRPEKLNAFTFDTLLEVRAAVAEAEADPRVVGIVVTGAGRGFCAGLDAAALGATAAGGSAGRPDVDPDEVPGIFTWLLAVDKPVIAAVNGVAAGGGFVLAVMADLRFASPAASFTSVFSKRGLIAEHGTTWVLPRLVGHGRALDLLWSSRRVDGAEAHRIGLVEHLTGEDDLLEQAHAYVADLAANVSPASMRDSKRLVYRHWAAAYQQALRETDDAQWEAMDRSDVVEGSRALLERRPASFARLGRKG